MNITTIGFTGTRRGMTDVQHASVAEVLAFAIRCGATRALHGDCVGADDEFDALAHAHGLSVACLPAAVDDALRAHTTRRGSTALDAPRPPLVRNARIVRQSTVMIAAPGANRRGGTRWTIGCAQKYSAPIAIVAPDGSITWERWL